MKELTNNYTSLTTEAKITFRSIVDNFFDSNLYSTEQNDPLSMEYDTTNNITNIETQSIPINTLQEHNNDTTNNITNIETQSIPVNSVQEHNNNTTNNITNIETQSIPVNSVQEQNNDILQVEHTNSSTTINFITPIPLRNRNRCEISTHTFFSCSDPPRMSRGQNTVVIKNIRKDDDTIFSDEMDLYIQYLLTSDPVSKSGKLILPTQFFTYGLRYVVQVADEYNAPLLERPKNNYVQFGEFMKIRPLMEPYSLENDERCRRICPDFPDNDAFKNIQKVR